MSLLDTIFMLIFLGLIVSMILGQWRGANRKTCTICGLPCDDTKGWHGPDGFQCEACKDL